VRNSKGKCVDPNECCNDPNAEITNCFSDCSGGTCDHPKLYNCSQSCIPRGCQCKKGFVKSWTGKCIPLNKCPKCTKKNQEYKPCGTRCPETCDNPNPICVEVCQPGCFCKEGYILHNGKCILKTYCPKKRKIEMK
jgi:hypothetical protein